MPSDPSRLGFTFAGWYTSNGVQFDPLAPITQNTDVYAYWYPLYEMTVTIEGTGSGTVEVDIGYGWFEYTGPFTIIGGTTIHIRAAPDSGHSFAGWTGGHTSTDPQIALTPTGDLTITATFNEPPAPEPPSTGGDDPFYKSWMFWIILVLIALLAVAMILFLRERRLASADADNIFTDDLDSDLDSEDK